MIWLENSEEINVIETMTRPMLQSDATHVARILRATNWFGHMAVETVDETRLRIERHIHQCRVNGAHSGYVAELTNGNVVGYALVHWLPSLFLPSPEGYLSELFVEEAYRGNGIGRRLLDAVVAEAKDRKCSRLSLIANRTRESYRRKYYLKAGWLERDGMAVFALVL